MQRMFGKKNEMLHPPVLSVEKLCVPLPPKCIYPRQRNIAIREMVQQSHTITIVSRSLTSIKMARLSIVVSFALALMQIIARAIYPYSELKTVRYLRENTALAEMFGIEEKILLFDITNSYFEGKMANSELCQYGRSKEKRDDCKIVVLAAVVNTPPSMICSTLIPNRSGKENPCYTQIRLQKIRILEIRELHNGWLQCGLILLF